MFKEKEKEKKSKEKKKKGSAFKIDMILHMQNKILLIMDRKYIKELRLV